MEATEKRVLFCFTFSLFCMDRHVSAIVHKQTSENNSSGLDCLVPLCRFWGLNLSSATSASTQWPILSGHHNCVIIRPLPSSKYQQSKFCLWFLRYHVNSNWIEDSQLLLFFFLRQSHPVALAVLQLILQTRIALNSETGLPLPPKGLKAYTPLCPAEGSQF